MSKFFDAMGRPSWDLYFMSLALMASRRSIDPATKHGAVVVDQDKNILSIGYNGPPRGCNDKNVPLTRPEKYDWIIHAEEAAITNAARTGASLKGSIFYVTGHPCEKCMRMIINIGAKKVVYGPIGSHCVSDKTLGVIKAMLDGQSIEMIPFEGSDVISGLDGVLDQLHAYLDSKSE